MMALPPDSSRLPGLREWHQSLVLSLRLGQAAVVLLLIFAAGTIASLLPLRLRDPGWYLTLADLLIANAPIAITAGCFGCLAVLLAPPDSSRFFRAKIALQRVSSILCLLYFLLLPLEILASVQMLTTYRSSFRDSVDLLQRSQQQIAARIRSDSDSSQQRSSLADQAKGVGTAAAPVPSLSERQKDLLLRLDGEQNRIRNGLHQQRQQNILRLLINASRVVLCALPIALFFRLLAKPSADLIQQFKRTSR